MQTVQISPETFARLQAHAVPLVDTIETVINKALDALEGNKIAPSPSSKPGGFDPSAPPNLSFTTVRSVVVANKKYPPKETYWNSALFACIKAAAKSGLSPKEVSDLVIVNNIVGVKDDSGYKYIKEAGISIQGQDANGAWKAAYHIAKQIGLTVEVSFIWQNNPKASFPGQTGKLSITK
ncbi:hypothetical protein [Mesorhizobium sp. B1-1-5]|uniref:T4SS efffector SepA family protein n=1 Tax=Mesorhizobium sp. B1-1-5 TaxID=2589979 RepID=UPI00112A351D|nr:hypothetical protein [Mesorhizobium sp. B1-1-5]TPN95285.1 hypothetical protein FJ980_26200 [Mesorhizobium sp. B1-1-5]